MIVISARNKDVLTEGTQADIVRDFRYLLMLTYQDNELWSAYTEAVSSLKAEVNEGGNSDDVC